MAPGRNKLIQFLVLILIYRIDTFCLAQETECKNGACRFKTLLLPAENDQEMKELPVEKAWEICAPSIPFNLTANSFMDCNSAECYFQKKNILKEDGTLNEGALDSYKELPMVNVLKQMCMDTWVPNGLIRKRREERQKRRLLAGTISNSIVDGIPIRHMKNFDSDIWFARHGRSAEEMLNRKKRSIQIGSVGTLRTPWGIFKDTGKVVMDPSGVVTNSPKWRPPQLPSFLQMDKNWQWGKKRSAESDDDESMSRRKRELFIGEGENISVNGKTYGKVKNMKIEGGRVAFDNDGQMRKKRTVSYLTGEGNSFNGEALPDGKSFNSDDMYGRYARSVDDESRRKRELFIGEGENISVNGKTYGKVKNMKIEGGHVTFDNDGQMRKKRTISYLTGEGNSFNGEALPDGKSFNSDDMYGRYARSADDETLGLAACLDESVEIALSMCAMDKLY